MADDLTLQVLREIRDEIRETRTSLGARIDDLRDTLRARIDATNQRIDGTNERLTHVEHAMLDLAEQQRFVVRWLKGSSARERRVERRLDRLEERVDAIEKE